VAAAGAAAKQTICRWERIRSSKAWAAVFAPATPSGSQRKKFACKARALRNSTCKEGPQPGTLSALLRHHLSRTEILCTASAFKNERRINCETSAKAV